MGTIGSDEGLAERQSIVSSIGGVAAHTGVVLQLPGVHAYQKSDQRPLLEVERGTGARR